MTVAQDTTSRMWLVSGQQQYTPEPNVVQPDQALFIISQLTPDPTNKYFPLSIVKQRGSPVAQITINLAAAETLPYEWGYRRELLAAFDQLRRNLTAQEASGGVIPNGAAVIMRQVAMIVPATFAESLYFAYGFYRDADRGYVDLSAGMRLRVDAQANQLVSTSSPGYAPGASGYVSGGQSTFDVVEMLDSAQAPQLVLDAFLGANYVPTVTAGAGGAAGIVDVQGPTQRTRFLRLCYPKTLAAGSSAGAVGVTGNVALLGANDLTALATATTQYYNNVPPDTSSSVVATYFRGRVTIVPEVLCYLNAEPMYLPVGTTVRQFTQRFAVLPRVPGLQFGTTFPFTRFVPSVAPVGQRFASVFATVTFTAGTGGPPDAFDLPLLASDAYTWLAG